MGAEGLRLVVEVRRRDTPRVGSSCTARRPPLRCAWCPLRVGSGSTPASAQPPGRGVPSPGERSSLIQHRWHFDVIPPPVWGAVCRAEGSCTHPRGIPSVGGAVRQWVPYALLYGSTPSVCGERGPGSLARPSWRVVPPRCWGAVPRTDRLRQQRRGTPRVWGAAYLERRQAPTRRGTPSSMAKRTGVAAYLVRTHVVPPVGSGRLLSRAAANRSWYPSRVGERRSSRNPLLTAGVVPPRVWGAGRSGRDSGPIARGTPSRVGSGLCDLGRCWCLVVSLPGFRSCPA
jgi:hypothetical protein